MPYIERAHAGEFVLSEGNGQISRDEVILAASEEDIEAGTIIIEGADEKYVPYAETAGPEGGGTAEITGSLAILYRTVPASENDQSVTVISRQAEVAGELLIGLTGLSKAALKSAGIIVR